MTAENAQLQQNLELLGGMYRALSSLRDEVLPVNPALYAVLAEGPLEQIQRLLCDLEAAAGVSTARELQADIWMRLHGPALEWPDVPTSILTSFLDALRKGIQTFAEYGRIGQTTPRPTAELKRASDLRVVAFQSGSIQIGLRLPEQEESDRDRDAAEIARHALGQYLDVALWLDSEDELESLEGLIPDSNQRRVLLNAMQHLLPRPRGEVQIVELYGRALPSGRRIRLGRETSRRFDLALHRTPGEQREQHEGELREIDLDNRSFILRDAHGIQKIRCHFDADFLEIALKALGHRVRVIGLRRTDSVNGNGPVRVTFLEVIENAEGDLQRKSLFSQ